MRKRNVCKWAALGMALALTVGTVSDANIAAAAKKGSVKLNKSSVTLQKGKKVQLKVTKKNIKKVKSITWKAKDKKVASVSKKGLVTAKKAGKTTVTATVKYTDKSSAKVQTKSLKCQITVKAAAQATPAPTTDPKAPLTEILDADDITLRVKSNDTSNVGEAREVSIVGGETMTVKDNGTMRTELSAQYLANNEMGLGINLGNTMEATLSMADKLKETDPHAFEQAWGAPITTQEYIDCVHSYGINTIRIPVAWTNMDSEDGTYTINEKYLGRVEEIVNYALNDGMYVVINDHWDNQWWGQFGAAKYDENGKKVANEEMRAEAWKRYEAYWTQIANRFKDYSDHLIFEGANEELGSRLNDRIYSNGYSSTTDENDTAVPGNLNETQRYETTNAINQKFVDIVRGTGGNNQYRHLLIAGYNTNISDTADERFVMPTDSANPDVNKLFLSVHYYTPWDFCGDGGTGEYTGEDQQYTKDEFAKLQRFTEEGYAIILGECGICNPTGVVSSVTQWLNDTFTECQKYSMVPCLWDTGAYFNRSEAKIKFKDIAVFYNTVTGANGDTNINKVTGKVEISDTVELTGLVSSWDWTGKWYKNGGDNLIGDDKFTEGGGTVVVKTDSTTSADLLAQFVPQNNAVSKITGDTTSITFNEWGYQAFLKVDVSKYEQPAISFDFLEGTSNEDNVGNLVIGATSDGSYSNDVNMTYDAFNGKAVVLSEQIGLSADKPYLSISFGNKPIVTGIHLYDLG